MDIPLFVLNTGGNHRPTNQQYKIQKKIMEKRFAFSTKYEIINKSLGKFIIIKEIFLLYLELFIIFTMIKIFFVFYNIYI